MFLDFALSGFDLCCAGVFGGFADEFAARGDTFTQLASGYTGYTGVLVLLTFLRRYPCRGVQSTEQILEVLRRVLRSRIDV